MTTEQSLLQHFFREYPAQPATAIWRAAEIATLLRHPFPSGRGLDLGCGDGKLTKIILDAIGHREMVGIDPDPQEAEQARELGIYKSVYTARGSEIPEPTESFDFVFSNSVLEHIPELAWVIADVARVLRRGGSFVFTVPAPGFHLALRGPLLPWQERRRYLAAVDKRLAHLHYLSHEEWRELLGNHGMDLVESRGYLSRRWVQRWELTSRATAGVLVALSGNRSRPIDIQRKLGIRNARLRWPAPVAKALQHILGWGLERSDVIEDTNGVYGCLLIVGRKR